MKLIKCNLQGQKHKLRKQPCEDSVTWLEKDGIFAVSVADGAGSSKYSEARYGSQVVSETVCKLLVNHFDELYEMANEFELRRIIEVVCKKALDEKAKSLGLDSYETMASTLLAVAVSQKRTIAIQIGDGVIGKLERDVAQALTTPRNGEFVGTTFFITQNDSYAYLQVQRFISHDISYLFLMTDGISDHIYNDSDGSFSNALIKMLSFSSDSNCEESLKSFVEDNIIDSDPCSDDSTIAILCLDENSVITKNTAVPDEQPNAENQHIVAKTKIHKKPLAVCKIISILVGVLIAGVIGFLCGNNLIEKPVPEPYESKILSIELYEISSSKEIGNNEKTLLGGFLPGDTITLQPQIRNTGNQTVFVYLEIQMSGSSKIDSVKSPPFLLMLDGEEKTSSNWTLLQESIDESGTFTAVYGFNKALEKGQSTDSLFNSVLYLSSEDNTYLTESNNIADNNNPLKSGQKNLLTVSATAIPANDGSENMIGAWERYTQSDNNAIAETSVTLTNVPSFSSVEEYTDELITNPSITLNSANDNENNE
ncbi:MAG: PP2C family serine/threonine-protein phosphatase [Acutalibacteraceae bacterium]